MATPLRLGVQSAEGAETSPLESGWPPLVVGLWIFGLYLLGGVIAYWHVWAHPTTIQPQSGGGDPALFDWYLRWTPWAISHGTNPFVSHIPNVPFGLNLVAQTSILGLGLIMAPVTVIWGPVASLNTLFTLAFPLSAAGGYLLARRFN